VVYAIAAYTITLGALALYWVMIQHRRREIASELGSRHRSKLQDPRTGFNLGACLLAPFWMLRHGMPIPGILVLIPTLAVFPLYSRQLWVPLLFVGMLPIAAGAALGVVANRIAVAHTGFEQAGELSASQLPWALTGIVLYLIVLPWAWYFTTAA
jgi:hypothetical protein